MLGPGDEREYGALQSLVDLSRINLAQKPGVKPEAVAVQSIKDAEFTDASLGIPEWRPRRWLVQGLLGTIANGFVAFSLFLVPLMAEITGVAEAGDMDPLVVVGRGPT